jgi:DNA-binding transcriptional ArsR family regulator
MVVYEFGGDVDAFMATLPGVGAVKETLATKEQFETARRFIHSPQFVEPLRAGGIPRVAGPIACLDALLETATPTRTTKIKITMCDLGDMYSVSAMSAHRHIKRLTEVGIIHVELIDGCTTVDLSNLLDKSVTVQERVNYCNTFINITDEAFYREHRGDDAFTSYPYAYAIKRRECPTVLMQSLGANGLLLWAALAAGGTIKELAEATGLKVASVRYALKKFIQAGLVIVAHYGRAKEYLLCSNAEEMLEGIRPEMVTAGKGQLSAGKNASATASYAHRQLSGNAPLEPGKRAWLENRRDKCDAKASAIYASLESMGINPHAKVAHRTPRPNTLRFDAVEEWRSWGRDMWEVLELLGDCDMSEKIRLLTIAEVGDDASVETYRNARRAIAERAELALSLAPRRASLERTYNHPDVEEDTPLVTVAPQTLFAMSFIYA